jgi:hypothetical protein
MDDRAEIERRINEWVIFRDSGDFDRLRELWSADGTITTTWFSGSADDFVAHSRRMFGAPLPGSLHTLGGISVDVRGPRAISQAKIVLSVFAPVHGTASVVTCWGRFYDFWHKVDGTWKIADHIVIYDRDRLSALEGTVTPTLDPAVLNRFPEGYRHLAYTLEVNGTAVLEGLPGLTGAAVEELYARGRAWLGP